MPRVSDDDLDELLRPPAGPKILTIDLERVPGIVRREIWHPSDAKRWNYIGPETWECLPRTVCVSAKWWGKRSGIFIAAWDDPDDEYHCARETWSLIDEADLVVTYNGKRSDIKWLQGDWDAMGLGAPRPYKSVDLFALQNRWALERRSLRFLLDRLSMANKDGHYNSAQAWAALGGDEKARRALRRYNAADVRVTEQLFDRLRHHVKGINLGVYYHDAVDVARCPACGEADTLKAAGWYTATVQRYALYTCSECGAHARSNAVKSRSRATAVR